MSSWAPLFSKIVDSSIWREPDGVVKVFITMLAKKGADHTVRANAYMIGEWAKKDEREVLDALKVLASPDTRRIEPQPFEGRRIEKVEGGWLILNGQFYEDEMRRISRRAYNARKQREYREQQATTGSEPAPNCKVKAPRNGKPLGGENLALKTGDSERVLAELHAQDAERASGSGPAGLVGGD